MYKDTLNHVWAPDETGRNLKTRPMPSSLAG